jgi:Lipid A 3-O-deacylase (PagL)
MYRSLPQLFIVFVFLFINVARAQENEPGAGFGIEVNTLAGKVIKHSQKFTLPIPALSVAEDVNFIWQTYGKKDWQQRRHFPMVGVGVTYTDYGNNLVLGRCVGVYPNVQIPIIRRGDLEWTLRLGNGLGYVTEKYQSRGVNDTQNIAIGSHINDFAIFMTDLRYHVDEHWDLQCGASFTHISNGDYHQPNLGVNMAGIHVGVRYFPVTRTPKPIIKDQKKLSNRWLGEFRFSMAYKEARAKGGPILPSYNFAGFVSRRWLSNNKFYFGADYAFHHDIYAFIKYYGIYIERHQHDYAWDGTFFAGNEFLVGRFGIVGQVGVYYHQTFLKFDDFCEKIGMNFYILQKEKGFIKELFVTGLVLTHEIVAQYAEFGIGAGF